MMAGVQGGIIDSFRNGGGVPYSEFEDFHKMMAELSGAIHDASLVETTLPLVPGMVERLQTGIEVLDIGCGSGHAVNLMAQAFPHSRFTGSDFTDEVIAVGQQEAQAWGLTNAQFAAEDVSALTGRRQFDFITAFDTIHD